VRKYGVLIRKHKKIPLCFFVLVFLLADLMLIDPERIYAGSISSSEAKVVAAAYAEYEYEGDKYRAVPEYIQQVVDYLSQDDVDLTEEKCNELLGMIESNIPAAIENGYIAKVGSDGKLEEPDKNLSSDNKEIEKEDIIQFLEKEETGQEAEGKVTEDPSKENPSKENPSKKKNKKDKKSKKNQTQNHNIDNNEEQPKQDGNQQDSQESDHDSNATVADSTNKNNKGSSNYSNDTDRDSKKNQETSDKKKSNTEENVFDFLYQADAQRREQDANMALQVVAVIVIILFLVFLIRLLYRHYTLYWSHSKASSGKKPENLTEMHCHILPGVDDGPVSMEMTRNMLKMEVENGVKTILFTPHFKRGKTHFNNEKLLRVFEDVKREAARINPDLKLCLGEELYYDHSLCDAIEQGKALKLNDTDYVLVEFSPEVEYKLIHKACQNLVMMGVTPLLAHIERYPALISKKEHLEEIRNMGVYYQMNAASVIGSNLSARTYRCRKLVVDGWIDVFGSDCHDDKRRVPNFKKAWKQILCLCDDEMAEKILWTNPGRILKGEEIDE